MHSKECRRRLLPPHHVTDELDRTRRHRAISLSEYCYREIATAIGSLSTQPYFDFGTRPPGHGAEEFPPRLAPLGGGCRDV
jgi:hypothetical protein